MPNWAWIFFTLPLFEKNLFGGILATGYQEGFIMSKENIAKLYTLLEKDLVLREKALSFQKMYDDQNQVIDAFMAFAADLGYDFTFEEFMEYMYTHAEEVK